MCIRDRYNIVQCTGSRRKRRTAVMYKSSARVLCVERYARWLSSSIRNGTSATPPIGSNELNNDSDRANARSAADVEGVANRLSAASPARKSRDNRRRITEFKDALNLGPSFADFVSGKASGMILDPLEKARQNTEEAKKLPRWLKVPIPKGTNYHKLKGDVKELKLSTVCEEARCPNIGECWGGKDKSKATATIMLLGDTCTRGCRFCSVKTNRAPSKPDPMEPENTAEAIKRWGLGYVVLTTVDRDDLIDGGANHLAETVRKIKQKAPKTLVETLSGDFRGDLKMVDIMAQCGLDVYAHNLETVEALTPHVRDRSCLLYTSRCV